MNNSEIVSFIWDIANLIRDAFKRGKYQDVILPFTVLRRLDCVLAYTKEKVLKREAALRDIGLEERRAQLCIVSGYQFYNTSNYDFKRLVEDPHDVATNLRHYISKFSDNMCEVLEKLDFDNTITKLDNAGLLFKVLDRFHKIDLHPDNVDSATMGTIFEELIRKFNEALNENPGEHFTPRDVVHLMVDLMLSGDEDSIAGPGVIRTVYDPCCGSGGMLLTAKEHITRGRIEDGNQLTEPVNQDAKIHLFGQEVNPETWAIAKSDLYMKDPTGQDAENIAFGSVLSNDGHNRKFDYLIANPPYGKNWKGDEQAVRAEHKLGPEGRFGPGLPSINDGQMLFLLHLVDHMNEPGGGGVGSRITVIMNRGPLFKGDAGSGESEIRRFIFEKDLLEALIVLPEQVFYNTNIATCVWVLTNRKAPERKGKVQLIDASLLWTPMFRSHGDKRRQISPGQAQDILQILRNYQDGETRTIVNDSQEQQEVIVSRIFPNTHFGFRKITVERPLRLNFCANQERVERLKQDKKFQGLAASRKRGEAGEKARADGRAMQFAILGLVRSLPDMVVKDKQEFEGMLANTAKQIGIKLSAPAREAILSGLSETDENANICRGRDCLPEPDTKLRDTERVSLSEDIYEFFEREILIHTPDAWIDESKRDRTDGEIGLIGYKINIDRCFHRYSPPRPLMEIESDISLIEQEILKLLDSEMFIDKKALNSISENWKVMRFSSVLDVLESGSREQVEISESEGVPNLGGEHIGSDNKLLLKNLRFVSCSFFDSMGSGIVKENDILLVKDGTIGKVALVRGLPYERCSINEHVFLIRPISGYSPEFLFYYLCSSRIQDELWSLAKGTAQLGLDTSFTKHLKVLTPPLEEQLAIIKFLDRETTRIDAMIEKRRSAIELLQEYRLSLISAAMTGQINVQYIEEKQLGSDDIL